jgi:two-component system phosphate regulon response regulator PhoB
VIVSAKGDEIDRVVGFEVGADDYVVKPFSARELVLRVEAIARARRSARAAAARAPARCYVAGSLQIDLDGHYLHANGRHVYVSALEMRLLIHLVENRGRVLSREELLEDVWGYKPGTATRTVDTHVRRLRRKLGSAGAVVETVRGTGYRIARGAATGAGQRPVTRS